MILAAVDIVKRAARTDGDRAVTTVFPTIVTILNAIATPVIVALVTTVLTRIAPVFANIRASAGVEAPFAGEGRRRAENETSADDTTSSAKS